ncbi:YdbH domain-containing protein [Shewanella sp. AS16]|uniref:YdbH domain-containing protein n=1 Tax=Shewanella sp. AS16 TaxID=2907625 RepID=UPI001F2979A4|nr:YdbH domain-containing protein [Shewanella sp. AS16]MCE9684794.1 YdbH domain-containing protein [Shewanella sp. AS16]
MPAAKFKSFAIKTLLPLALLLSLSVWALVANYQWLALTAANHLLADYDIHLDELELKFDSLEEWHFPRLKFSIKDNRIELQDLRISLDTSPLAALPFALPQFGTRQLKRISSGPMRVLLGQTLFQDRGQALDEQGPALALDLDSLPQIHLGRTRFSLAGVAPEDFSLEMESLRLNRARQLTTALKFDDRPLLQLHAQLDEELWRLDTRLDTDTLYRLALATDALALKSPLTDRLAAAVAVLESHDIRLEGQLVSRLALTLKTAELSSHHRLMAGALTLGQFDHLRLAPEPELALAISGRLGALQLTLEPVAMALRPSRAGRRALLALLAPEIEGNKLDSLLHALSSGAEASESERAKGDTGLSTAADLGLRVTLPTRVQLPLANMGAAAPLANMGAAAPLLLERLSLELLNSRIQTKLEMSELSYSAQQGLSGHWALELARAKHLALTDLFPPPAAMRLSLGGGHLQAGGELALTAQQASLSLTEGQLALEDIEVRRQGERTATTTTTTTGSTVTQQSLNLASARLKLGPSNLTWADKRLNLHAAPPQLTLTDIAFKQQVFAAAQAQVQVQAQVQPRAQAQEHSPWLTDGMKEGITANLAEARLALARPLRLSLDTRVAGVDALLAQPWQNELTLSLNEITSDKQQQLKLRLKQQRLFRLAHLSLQQQLQWQGKELRGKEHWQLDDLKLDSRHTLTLMPTADSDFELSGHWQMDSKLADLLALYRRIAPLPAELEFSGQSRLSADVQLRHGSEDTLFAIQFQPKLQQVYGNLGQILLHDGDAEASCEYRLEARHERPTAADAGNANSRLDCADMNLTIGNLDLGVPVTNLALHAGMSLSKDPAKVADNWLKRLTGLSDVDLKLTAGGDLLGGQFLLPTFKLQLQERSHAYLMLQGLSLEELLTLLPQQGVHADGIFDGVLPVDLIDGRVSVSGGRLAARPPGGLIAIKDNPAIEQMRLSQPYLDFAFSALEHLNYSQLSGSFDMTPASDATIKVEVKGHSLGIERPIHLNYSQEENMLQLFRSLQIGNDLQDRIEQSVK